MVDRTKFKPSRNYPAVITVTDDIRSHTLALQAIIENLDIHNRRTRDIASSFVRLRELVDIGLIEIVNGQLKLTNLGETVVDTSGFLATVQAGHGIDIDATDPNNPIIHVDETELTLPAGYTDEEARDAVGGILTSTTTVTLTYTDAGAGAGTITAVVIPGGVDHNSLLNFSANKHIDHTAVTLTAGAGLTGGGTIAADRSFALDVTYGPTWTSTHTFTKVGSDSASTIQLNSNQPALEFEEADIPATWQIASIGGELRIRAIKTDNSATDSAMRFIQLAGVVTNVDFDIGAAELTRNSNVVWDQGNVGTRINAMTQETSIDGAADLFPLYDVSAAAGRVATANDLIRGSTLSTSGAMQFVGSATLGGAGTTLTVNGLNLLADETYFCELTSDNSTAGTITYNLYFNGDTTAGNYDTERDGSNGASNGSAGANNASFLSNVAAGANSTAQCYIRLNFDGKAQAQGSDSNTETTTRTVGIWSVQYRTAANVTSISVVASGNMSSGAKLKIYRISSRGSTANSPGGTALDFVGEAVVAGGAVTTLTLSGLDLTNDDHYIIESSLKNATGSAAAISVYINGDTTAGNYDRQSATDNGTSQTSSRANTAAIGTLPASGYMHTSSIAPMTLDLEGKPRCIFKCNIDATTAILTQDFSWRARTAANVTSITISSAVASALDNASYIRVWRMRRVFDQSKAQGSDLVITSNAAYQNTDLIWTNVPVGTYEFEIKASHLNHATPKSNFRVHFTGTATSYECWRLVANDGASAGASRETAFDTVVGPAGITDNYTLQYSGTITVSVAGTLSYQVAQNSSSATSITFRKGSRGRLRRIA